MAQHSTQVITYQGPHGGPDEHRTVTLCVACAEREGMDHGRGYTVSRGLEEGICDRDPVQAARIAEEQAYRRQEELEQAADDC
jgi:hypothetical protein